MRENNSRMKIDLKRLLFGKRLIVLIGVMLTVAAAPVGILTFNQYMNAEATSEAVSPDVQSYADEWGIETDEAARRLALQDTIGELRAELLANESDTFAGLWITHGTAADDFGAVASFTRDGEQTLRQYSQYIDNGPLAGTVEVVAAGSSLEDLRTTRKETISNLKGLGVPVESGIDVKGNRVEIYVVQRDQLESAMTSANVTLPDKVDLVTVSGLSEKAVDIYGGLYLEGNTGCTLGFSVEDTDGNRYITTAAHCEDSQSYNGTSLPVMDGQFFDSDRDVQWHTAPGFTVTNEIHGAYRREITGTRATSQQTIGTYVCKRGKATGYGCGYIIHTYFLPDDDKYTCIPDEDCSFVDTWIRIHRDGVDLADPGDSGGPVFKNGIAYGTISIHFGDDAIYSPIDFFTSEGLLVLTD